MQSEKHLNAAVLLYLFSLLILVVFNMIDEISIIDVGYLVVLLCCVLKFFLIMREERK